MKKKILIMCVFVFLLSALLLTFSSCEWIEDIINGIGGEGESDTYTITYWTGSTKHEITVTSGESYSIGVIPYQYGYDFIGLYDSEIYGASDEEGRFVDEKGKSLMPFTDNRDMTLYPHFKAKTCEIEFDLQGAIAPSGFQPTYSLPYGSQLKSSVFSNQNPEMSHYEFTGWYTEPDCKGTKVVDNHGAVRVTDFTEDNFEFDVNFRVRLYAGFELEKHAVTIYITETSTKRVNVAYGTDISTLDLSAELSGKVVIAWERNYSGNWEKFSGIVTQDMTLRIVDSAYKIKLEVDGGSVVEDIVAQDGDMISLPQPTRDFYSFLGWYDNSGARFDSSVMPARSFTLTARWQQCVVTLNSAGGSKVNDITIDKSAITLPVPTKEGHVFCGWFTSLGKFYYDVMQDANQDVVLTAKWITAIIHSETSFWSNHIDTGNRNADVANHSKEIAIPAELAQAVKLGKIGAKITARVDCSVQSEGNATANAITKLVINGKEYEGARTSSKGDGYNFWGNPKNGKWGEANKTISEKIVLKANEPIVFGAIYTMTSDKENSKVSIEAYYMLTSLTIELYNI